MSNIKVDLAHNPIVRIDLPLNQALRLSSLLMSAVAHEGKDEFFAEVTDGIESLTGNSGPDYEYSAATGYFEAVTGE